MFDHRWFITLANSLFCPCRKSLRYLPAAVVFIIGMVGCGSGPTVRDVPAAQENLRLIGVAYGKATIGLHRPPANLQEFLPYLKQQGDTEKLLRSPIDGEEYVIYWNKDLMASRPGDEPVLAHEKQGEGGRRYVLHGRYVERLSEEALQKALTPPVPSGT